MLLRKQILAWVTILVFSFSTTGVSIYNHICNVADYKSVTLSELWCEDLSQLENCCNEDENARANDDCCDNNISFNKYIPNGNIEQQSQLDALPVSAALPLYQFRNFEASLLILFKNKHYHQAPDPHISNPKSVSQRLAEVQSYVC